MSTGNTEGLSDARLFIRGCDLSGQANEVSMAADREVLDKTSFKSAGWKEVRGGLPKAAITASGMVEFGAAGTVDYDAWARLGQVDPWTVGPDEATAGNLAYLTKVLRGQYKTLGKVGALNPWEAECMSSWPVARGIFLLGPGTVLTDDGASSAFELGALAAGQRLYATLHVVSVVGAAPTLDVTITSDSVEAFTGSPETRITFTQASVVGGEALRSAAGAHTDSWYRAEWDLSEVGDESFLAAVAVGIY
jgi:hypothetical protein